MRIIVDDFPDRPAIQDERHKNALHMKVVDAMDMPGIGCDNHFRVQGLALRVSTSEVMPAWELGSKWLLELAGSPSPGCSQGPVA